MNFRQTLLFCTTFLAVSTSTWAQTPIEPLERDFQIGLISPLGSNGMDSHKYTNKVSINLVGGYSQGNTAFEMGGVYNINTQHTKGLQLAGVANYSGDAAQAVQIAGVTNLAPKSEVRTQIGGIFNMARKVKGLQLGLINYADESDGVSIGLINIVRKGGKQEFELSASEALNTTLSFKLGTDALYTIFSVGANYVNNPITYAAGIGFGTQLNWQKGWANQIELMGYTLSEEKSFNNKGVNMLTQLKLTTSKQLGERFHVFAGPVLNMTISEYVNPETGALGSSLAPWSMWNNKSDNTRLNAWIGFTAGVRL